MDRAIVFFDIDGTLLDHNKQLPSSTKHAIQALKREGHDVAIATGRAPFLFENLREELEIDSFVSFNGQYVVLGGEVIYKNPLNTKALDSLTKFANKYNHPLVYMGHEIMKANSQYHPHIDVSIGTLGVSHPGYDPHYFVDREIFQALLFCPDEEEAQYRDGLKDLNFIRWHQFSMDVLPLGGSKAQGIEKAIEKLGYTKEQVYAFGDYLNDIEMLQFVGNGVAMGNAPDLVKNVAKYVTKDVSDNGIAHGLKLVGLLR
ncbi:Cof-type HAD-IIB family hydrolase [Neobacillus cucumis]|uniref:Cof-type HAD-IIB family hydrolase n=1 Tax=Neobacillus cucumis TaxID=1740721 RepID=UPI00203E22C3|nr:Cof-type HAD-IIB family hydrolase [Neobacillus cucumis]MCM3728163.1 Cof-type HAD-IIB family hydrolase [Neobacillus cucumis]